MKKYDYFEAIKNDVMTYIKKNYDEKTIAELTIVCEIYEEFGDAKIKLALFSAEDADVTISCCLLSRAINRAIEDIQNRISYEKFEREVE